MSRNTREPVRQYRGSTAQHQAYTGPEGELTVDTTKMTAVVQDGVTVGGHPLMREDAPDGTTIKTNANGKLFVPVAADETVGLVKPDNETTFVDADGKLRTKSIPFESGSVLRIKNTTGVTNFPHSDAIEGNNRYIIPTLAESAFIKSTEGADSSFFTFDNDSVIFTKAGLYGVFVIWDYRPSPVDNATAVDIGITIEVDRSGEDNWDTIAGQTGEVDSESFLDERTSLSTIALLEAGTRLRTITSIPKATAVTSSVECTRFEMQIVKLPVTNEYQIQNPALNIYAILEPMQITPLGVGQATPLPVGTNFRDEMSRRVTRKVDDDITQLEILEDGFYNILAELSVNISETDPVQYDILFQVISQQAGVLGTGTLHLMSASLNPDVASVSTQVYLKAGDRLFVQAAFPIQTPYEITWFSLLVTKFPSVAQTSTDSGVEFDPAVLHPSAADSNVLDLGGVGTPSEEGLRLNLDTLLRGGFFSSYAFDGTLPNSTNLSGLLISILTKGVRDGKYWPHQLFTNAGNLYMRAATAGVDVGGTPNFGAWSVLGAPKPKISSGDFSVGTWVNIHVQSNVYTLPAGGVYATMLHGMVPANPGVKIYGTICTVKAGGTKIIDFSSESAVTMIEGFIWRIA